MGGRGEPHRRSAAGISLSRDVDVVLHGDCTPANVLVQDGRVVALHDFEWSGRGPRDIELALPAFVDWVDGQEPGSARPGILPWLAEFYPNCSKCPTSDSASGFYRVGFALRGLIHWPAFAPEPELPKGRQHARALPAA
jgi:aminoglycoside phosphotransferase (APT) family kinase protein